MEVSNPEFLESPKNISRLILKAMAIDSPFATEFYTISARAIMQSNQGILVMPLDLQLCHYNPGRSNLETLRSA